METTIYNNWKFRTLAAFVGSLYIVLFGRFSEILTALFNPRFHYALGISFVIALMIVNIVHYSWIWLDKKYSWQKRATKRIIFQFILGIVLPLVVDLLLITLYFGSIGQSILDSGFIDEDFILVSCLVFVINLYYVFLSFLNRNTNVITSPNNENIQEEQQPDEQDASPENSLFTIRHKGTYVHINPPDILCIYSEGRKVVVLTTGTELYQHSETIASIEKRLSTLGFCRISKGAVINLEAVQGYFKGPAKKTMKLIVKEKYREHYGELLNDKLLIRKAYHSGFNDAFTTAKEGK